MSRMSTCWGWFSSIAISGMFSFCATCTVAEGSIVPDNTLGTSNSVVTPNVVIQGVPSEEISGGVTRGANLLHSFQEFNIDPGRGAYFTNPAGVENILTRVTGTNPSQILGKLGVLGGNANLFLINPNGIIFGETASLDVMGSFVGTTANAIRLTNGDIFSTNSSQPLPTQLLNVNPNAFLSNQIANQVTRSIQVNQVSLSVRDGMSLLLLGGNISLDGSTLEALGGNVELGGLVSGTVDLQMNGNHLNLHLAENILRGDVFFVNGTKVDVTDKGQGSVAINAINIEILGESRISAGIQSGAKAVNESSQDVTLNATGVVTISQNSQINNQVERNATGNAGYININAGRVEVTGGQIRTRTLGEGNAGNINIKAGEILVDNPTYTIRDSEYRVAFEEKAALDASNDGTFVSGKGRSGNILLEASGSIALIGRGDDVESKVISTYTNATGRGGSGDILLKAGSISLNNAYIVASSFNSNAGEIRLQGNESISLTNNSAIVTTAFAQEGNSGNITLNSSGSVSVENSLISTNIGDKKKFSFLQQGNAGNISLSGRSVFVTAGSEVRAKSSFGGNSGNIQVDAIDIVEISGRVAELFSDTSRSGALYSLLQTTTEEEARGQAGNININVSNGILRVADGASLRAESNGNFNGGSIIINTKEVELTGGGKLLTSASSKGDAGNITLNTSDRIVISGRIPDLDELFNETAQKFDRTAAERIVKDLDIPSGIYANTSNTSTGQGGNISITTGQLIVRDNAQISVSSGQKNAGNLDIAAKRIHLDRQGVLIANSVAGEGGNVQLRVQDLLLLRRNSQISAISGTAQAGGNGGNFTAHVGFIVAVPKENSDIITNAFNGKGGNIFISAHGIFGTQFRKQLTPMSDIVAIGKDNMLGSSDIFNLELVQLPTNLIDASQLIATACNSGGKQTRSSFIATGRGGISPSPIEPLMADAVLADWIILEADTENRVRVAQNREIEKQSSADTYTHNVHSVNESAQIVEAQGWIVDANGDIVLVNQASANPQSPLFNPASCSAS